MTERAPWSTLSDRELEVFLLLAEGLTDAEIGQKLNISSKTVNYHVENVKRRLGAKNRVQAIATALRRRLID
jgi:DNA-binding CsgD family transcriptional regulator